MTGQLELFLPGWDIEPCDTALDVDLAVWLTTRPRPIPGDHGRPAGRPTYWRTRRITNVPTGELL